MYIIDIGLLHCVVCIYDLSSWNSARVTRYVLSVNIRIAWLLLVVVELIIISTGRSQLLIFAKHIRLLLRQLLLFDLNHSNYGQ